MIRYDESVQQQGAGRYPKIVLLGVGGAGGNTVNAVKLKNISGIYCVAVNTDLQALDNVYADQKIQLGEAITKGMGTGANPEIGKIAAEEDIQKILDVVEFSDIVFLVGGLGGGTGSGALPVIARVLQEKQILSIVLVTKPFAFEGARRAMVAANSLQKIEEYADTLIVIPNQKLFDSSSNQDVNIPLVEAFNQVNNVIIDCIQAVTETINNPGNINIDFADIKSTMTRMGKAIIGIGRASGENRAEECIIKAVASPLLEQTSLKGARSILINIHADTSLTLNEMNLIASYIGKEVHPDAHIIIGSSISQTPLPEIQLTLIATCFDDQIKTRTVPRVQQNHYVSHQALYSTKQPQNGYYSSHTQAQQAHHGAKNTFFNDLEQPHGYDKQIYEPEQQPQKKMFHEITKQSDTNEIDIPTFFRKQSANNKHDEFNK